jgi:hypothetical protein
MHDREHMSCDHHPPLCDVTTSTENTASSIVACWAVFTQLLPGNGLIKSVILSSRVQRLRTRVESAQDELHKDFESVLCRFTSVADLYVNL